MRRRQQGTNKAGPYTTRKDSGFHINNQLFMIHVYREIISHTSFRPWTALLYLPGFACLLFFIPIVQGPFLSFFLSSFAVSLA